MKWEGRKESENVEDRRGKTMKAGMAVGGGGILILILSLLFGLDPKKVAQVVGQNPGGGQVAGDQGPKDPEEEKQASFTKVVFRDTEDIWDELFQRMGRRYEKPVLVLFTDQVASACGLADAAVGPFYCPGDSKVYIDLA